MYILYFVVCEKYGMRKNGDINRVLKSRTYLLLHTTPMLLFPCVYDTITEKGKCR